MAGTMDDRTAPRKANGAVGLKPCGAVCRLARGRMSVSLPGSVARQRACSTDFLFHKCIDFPPASGHCLRTEPAVPAKRDGGRGLQPRPPTSNTRCHIHARSLHDQ
jgi:hypothetical protein